MNCWHCNAELIWDSDVDAEDMGYDHGIVTFLHCSKCEATVEVMLPIDKKEDTDSQNEN